MDRHEFLCRACLESDVLEAWLTAGWLVCGSAEEEWHFTEIDVARAQLIHDLRRDMGVNDEGVGVVLDLLDKLHGLRHTLGQLLDAVRTQPDDVRARLLMSLERAGRDPMAEVDPDDRS
jgi:chaperone modulatory protein CbpM